MNIWNDYSRVPLPELLSFVVDNRGKTVPTDAKGNHKLIATNCIRNENLYPSYEKIRLLSEETYQTWFRAHPIPGDIIFVCKGTPGRTCMVPNPIDFCIAQDMIAFRVNANLIYNRYLLAVLRSREIQEQITNTSVGDVIPHFKKQFLDQLLIPVPPMEIQKKVGDLYFAIALKEELNKQINDNLAELLMTMYEESFRDNSTKPSGKLSDICVYSTKKIPVSELSHTNYISTENMLANKAGATDAATLPTAEQVTRFSPGDTLISNIRPYFKKILYCYRQGGCSNDVLCLSPVNETLSAYLFCTVYVDHFFDYMVAGSKGTKMPRGDKKQILLYPIHVPTAVEIEDFNKTALPILTKISLNRDENIRLIATRDALLPRLMSGEIDVSAVQL